MNRKAKEEICEKTKEESPMIDEHGSYIIAPDMRDERGSYIIALDTILSSKNEFQLKEINWKNKLYLF